MKYTEDFVSPEQEYIKARTAAVAQMKAANENPYPHKHHVSTSLIEFIECYKNIDPGTRHPDVVSVAGATLYIHR